VAKVFNLTPCAKEDLRSIWNYTFDVWSEAQADLYLTELYERFEWLSEQPRIGMHRPDICEGYYCFPQSSHLVFYLIHDGEIDIIGVPHKDMDTPGFFESET